MSFSVCFLVSLCIYLPLTRSLAPASLPTHISFDIIAYCMISFSSFSFHYHSRDSVCSLACWTSVFVYTLLLPVLQPTPLSSSAAPLPIPFPLRFFPNCLFRKHCLSLHFCVVLEFRLFLALHLLFLLILFLPITRVFPRYIFLFFRFMRPWQRCS